MQLKKKLCVDQIGSQCENWIIAIKLASQELSKIVWKKCRKWWDYAMTLCASIFSWKARKIEKIVKMCIFIKRKNDIFWYPLRHEIWKKKKKNSSHLKKAPLTVLFCCCEDEWKWKRMDEEEKENKKNRKWSQIEWWKRVHWISDDNDDDNYDDEMESEHHPKCIQLLHFLWL